MNNFILNRIDEVKKNGFSINIGNIFSRAWDIFSETAFYVISGVILPMVISFIIKFILGIFISIPLFIVTNTDDFSNLSAQILTRIALFGMGLSFFINAALAPINISVLTIAKKYDEHKNVNFNDLLIHYRDGKLGKIILASILIHLILFSVSMLITLYQMTTFFILSILIYPFILSLSLLIYPFIVFSNLSVVKSIKYSVKILFKNFGQSFLFCLACLGIVISGVMIPFRIGLLVAVPLIYVGVYVFYKDVIGFKEEDSNEIIQLENTNEDQSNY